MRGRVIQMGPVIDAILARHAYPPVGRPAAGRSHRACRPARLLAEVRGQVHPADAHRRPGRHAGRRLPHRRRHPRLCPFRRCGGGGRAARPARPARRAARPWHAGHDHRPGRPHEPLPGRGAARRRRASRRSPTPISANRSRSPPACASPSPRSMCARATACITRWRAGGLLVQFLPDAPERMRQADLPGGDDPAECGRSRPNVAEDDAWTRGAVAGWHRPGRRADRPDGSGRNAALPPVPRARRAGLSRRRIRDECSCSRERVAGLLSTFTAEEIAESTEDGAISVTCEFCGTRSTSFDPADFAAGPKH